MSVSDSLDQKRGLDSAKEGEPANVRHVPQAIVLHFYLVEYEDGAGLSSYGSESTGRETVAYEACQ